MCLGEAIRMCLSGNQGREDRDSAAVVGEDESYRAVSTQPTWKLILVRPDYGRGEDYCECASSDVGTLPVSKWERFHRCASCVARCSGPAGRAGVLKCAARLSVSERGRMRPRSPFEEHPSQ